MKKLIYSMIIFMLCLGIANAKKCNVISGTGKNIGDEIVCGTEHFYVLENDGNTVKMLAKYNLYIGFNYEYKELDKSFDTEEDAANYAYELYGEEYERLIEIYQDEKGKWYFRVYIDDIFGNRKQKERSGFATKKEAQKAERELVMLGVVGECDMTFEELWNNYNEFIKVIKKEFKETTYDKLEKIKTQVNFANSIMNYFKK